MSTDPGAAVCGRRWVVRGQVQGVGFRPFVYRIATRHLLAGWVRNDPGGVAIEAWGSSDALDAFHRSLTTESPQLARIDRVECHGLEARGPVPRSFRIAPSDQRNRSPGRVTIDSATCQDCLGEMANPSDRRYRHAFINCTNCGPRFTIIRGLPYDRAATTMTSFPMCPRCAAEYSDPLNRRFHAQPVCCPECGPRATLRLASGEELPGDPFLRGAAMLRAGHVLAVKGLGGYHLAADACNEVAVALLRRRKRRDRKPFAIMVRDAAAAQDLVSLTDAGLRELTSPAAPIVLAPVRSGAPIADAVAPGQHRLGVMIASTPVHHLLFAQGLGPLVMTSANASDDPLVTDDGSVWRDLRGMFDAVLAHDRPIERAVDDSVLLDGAAGLIPLRRARGYAPGPVRLPRTVPSPGVCAGAELKNTLALVRDDEAIVSQHIGDLRHPLACARFTRTLDDLQSLFAVRPEWVACDAHPDSYSHRRARAIGVSLGVPVYRVQHHHAHLASLLAEHGRTDRVIGLVCDGVGYGEDGAAWGGEILVGELASYQRVGRLRPLRLPGADAAAVETGRCAASWLWDLLGPACAESEHLRRALPDPARRAGVCRLLAGDMHCPPSSGMGRLFDACAALLGVCERNHYEAMSGQLLESLAWRWGGQAPAPGLVTFQEAGGLLELDHRPLLGRLLQGLDRAEPVESLASLFHHALADGLAGVATVVARRTGLGVVGLTGGVFCNELLTRLVAGKLEHAGLTPLLHSIVPPNDGGLSLGQGAAVAAMLEHADV